MQPELELIEKIYKEIESKYRGFKKQIEVIEDRIIENQILPEDPVITSGRYDTEVINSARIFSCFFFHFVPVEPRA